MRQANKPQKYSYRLAHAQCQSCCRTLLAHSSLVITTHKHSNPDQQSSWRNSSRADKFLPRPGPWLRSGDLTSDRRAPARIQLIDPAT